MIRLFRRRPQPVLSFADIRAQIRAAQFEAARRRQEQAWATYAPNICTVGFVR